MELVRTTKVIDELLVRAAERALCKRVLDDYSTGAVDTSLPIKLCADAIQRLLSGEYMVDEDGHSFEECVTDSDDRNEWLAKVGQAKRRWARAKEERALFHDQVHNLGLAFVQSAFELTHKRDARKKLQEISEDFLGTALVAETLEKAVELLEHDWYPEHSCHRLRSDAIDWLVGSLELPEGVAKQAKEGTFSLGLMRSEHYSRILGLYIPEPENLTRVRCELRYPDPLVCMIMQRTTIIHEAVHAVTAICAGSDHLDHRDELFWEGMAELCTWDYLEDQLRNFKDWLFMPHSAAYQATTPPKYARAHQQARSVLELTHDYRILLPLVRMQPFTEEGTTVRRMQVIERIRRMIEILGQAMARRLVQNILSVVPEESLPRVLHTVGGLSQDILLSLVANFDETWKGLVEVVTY